MLNESMPVHEFLEVSSDAFAIALINALLASKDAILSFKADSYFVPLNLRVW